ncbi:MAG TPA: glycogen debranching N-terminal domain-containing protein [Acidimicrobiales bacterium]|nr:glycogen debranching N-terminal domain-containing protein [Acidimicrobiales bacterium]
MTDAASPYAGTTPVASLTSSEGAVTLVEGQSFCLSGRTGDIAADFPHGLFVFDTRVLSRWELRLNGHRLEPLSVDVRSPFHAAFIGRSAPAAGQADADVVVFRHRHVGQGMRERIVVSNHGLAAVPVTLELSCDVDFADLFEVKESRVVRRGSHARSVEGSVLRFEHRHDRLRKEVAVKTDPPATAEPGMLVWHGEVAPQGTWELCVEVRTSLNGTAVEPRFACGTPDAETVPAQRLATWHARLPTVRTDHLPLAETMARSAEDLGALRIFDPDHPELAILAAGAPWFMTVFGRDSLLTAWMTLLADPTLAHGVLETLARFQGDDVDPSTEEEPGKILHEMRFGTAAGLSLGGGNVYYGSVDATPLFVMLLAELRRWDARDELVERLLPHADRALAWIEEFGDRDGDGYVEYRRATDRGLANQGWKDSWDAIRHADGALAEAPIALCEVQGYVYAAYVARAHLAEEAGDEATCQRYLDKARELRRRFNEDFWVEEHGWYALALDADKRPVDVLASNVGHCLWTGIVDPAHAPLLARRLVADDMFSGFGIRTLSASARAYNPVSYHNGSVWPHDNALCAAGLMRYGFVEEAQRVILGQLDVARAHDGRLPELFAGFDRRVLSVPASYPTSCSPQAWAAAAPLLWVRTLLRLDPWATKDRVWIDPQLPSGMRRLSVSGIRIGSRALTVEVDGDHVDVGGAEGLEVFRRARPPLTGLLEDMEP